jgi:ubiquinone/menaquinone biosynthesis C-methylase UbiE
VNRTIESSNASFDAVLLEDLLEHIREPVASAAEVYRILRPGGLVFEFATDAQRWVWDEYAHRRPFPWKT